MNNYLKGYLASIPEYDYNKIIAYLAEIMAVYLPEIDLESILANISKRQEPTVYRVIPTQFQRASQAYNEIYSKVYIDLNYLYRVIDLLYAATNNYSDLSSAYIAEINSEIDRIYNVLEEIKTRETYRENIFIFKEEFKTKVQIEDNDLQKNKFLYQDRDGSDIPLCEIISTNTKSYAILKNKEEKDLLRNTEGDVQSKIFIRNYCGLPRSDNSLLALDGSKYTYWDTSVYSRAPIRTFIENQSIYGSWLKFVVQLPKICNVSNIEVMPFGSDPSKIKVYINNKLIVEEETNDTLFAFFPEEITDEIIIELLQENYIYDTITINDKEAEALELWETKLEERNIFSDYIGKYLEEFDEIANKWEYQQYE